MKQIKTAVETKIFKMSKSDWQSIGKQAGWFSKEEAPVRTKEDALVDHFKNRIVPKVKAELKRVADLDYHYVYLVKSIEKGLENMLSAYDKVNMRNKDVNKREKVKKILLEDPSGSLDSLSQGLAPFLDSVNKTKGADPIEHRIALKNYHDGLQRLYNLLHEFAENYFQVLGRTDAIPKKNSTSWHQASKRQNQLSGGLADDSDPQDFDQQELKMGIAVEMKEHTHDREKAKEIAMDHLKEFPNYYTLLNKMEAENK